MIGCSHLLLELFLFACINVALTLMMELITPGSRDRVIRSWLLFFLSAPEIDVGLTDM